MYKAFLICAMIWCVSMGGMGQTADSLDRGIGLFREGYLEWNASKMESGLRVLQQSPPSPESIYWQLVVQFQRVLCLDEVDPRETVQALEAALGRTARVPECEMMLAVLYGRQVADQPVRAVWLGRKIKALRKRALATGSENPRVQLLAGLCWMKAPRPFGSRERAREHLLQSAKLFVAEAASERADRLPRWGAAECSAHLGELMAAEGDEQAARQSYQNALQINPAYKPAQQYLKELNDDKKE